MVGDGKAGREGTTYSLFTDFMACQGGLRVRLGIHPEHGRCASSNDLFSKQGDEGVEEMNEVRIETHW